jgi:hypothetical protein
MVLDLSRYPFSCCQLFNRDDGAAVASCCACCGLALPDGKGGRRTAQRLEYCGHMGKLRHQSERLNQGNRFDLLWSASRSTRKVSSAFPRTRGFTERRNFIKAVAAAIARMPTVDALEICDFDYQGLWRTYSRNWIDRVSDKEALGQNLLVPMRWE